MEELNIYIGNYESDIYFDKKKYFKTITNYGSNTDNNISFCSKYKKRINIRNHTKEKTEFILNNVTNLTNQYENISFDFYNQSVAHKILANIPNDVKVNNINEVELLKILNNKFYTKQWLSNVIPIIPSIFLHKTECDFSNISNYFKSDKFIIQNNGSSGGNGTFIMDKFNEKEVLSDLLNNALYSISPYIEDSISININILISEKSIHCFPASIQLMKQNNNKLLYVGNDFKNLLLNINSTDIDHIYKQSNKIAAILQKTNYRGILGIDFLVAKNKVYFLEINPRFQGSSFLISKVLNDTHSISLHELNNNCFKKDYNLDIPISFKIDYIYYKVFNLKTNYEIEYPFEQHLDGFKKNMDIESEAYCNKKIIIN